MFWKNKILTGATLSLLALNAFSADNATSPYVLVAPTCLLKNLNLKLLAKTQDLTLIETDAAGIEALIEAKHRQKKPCGGFMDVTADWQQFQKSQSITRADSKNFLMHYSPSVASIHQNYTIQYEKEVHQLLKQLNPTQMWNDLTTLSNFKDRYANSDYGVTAAHWLKAQVEQIAKDNHREDVSVSVIETGNRYKQPSVVVKFGKSNAPGIVVGGHMDTLSSTFGRKPGADDDGSGTVTALATARTLLSSGMNFKKPIYFIWYAAEEEGLVGSGYVVSEFKKKGIPVDAVIHFDMTGYANKNDPTLWLINDYVNKDLTAYLETLINTYVKKPVKYTRCGYACSDHASWTQKGYASAMAFESAFGKDNPNIHSSSDTMEWLSLDHMTSYAQLGVAFATELAEPVV